MMKAGRLGVISRGILRIPHLPALAGAQIVPIRPWPAPRGIDAVAVWGRRPGSERARARARRWGLPCVALEDGFLRSVHGGADSPPLSMVWDDEGVYYDASAASRLERLVRADPGPAAIARARALREAWVESGVSKYNAARDCEENFPESCVLVADQTFGDASVRFGAADAGSFVRMLEAALDENPRATVLLKIHPEVASGRKRGYFDLARLPRDPRLRVIAADTHLPSLLARVQTVYSVTSQAGFEALLWGRSLRVFGMPFYAGWGLSVDEQRAPDRRSSVCLEQLVHAALIAYPRYIDPLTGECCEVERLLDHLALQRRMRARFPPEVHAVGFSPWKKKILREFADGSLVHFHRNVSRIPAGATVFCWGRRTLPELAGDSSVVRIEDGFLRSVGLGADLVRPLSWVFDSVGIHYDAGASSSLEQLLSRTAFSPTVLQRAARLRERIIAGGISKYNLRGGQWCRGDSPQQVVLVVGQVETDAAVLLGSASVRSNLALVRAVRALRPQARLLFKPHPDVAAGLRRRGPEESHAAEEADEVLGEVSISSVLDQVDEVHVISSLAGFEALLRGRRVVCHGLPFYAGWGLTTDRQPSARRQRLLSLDELVAGVLILYPTYRSPDRGCFISAEEALDEIRSRSGSRPGGLERIRGFLLRRVLKLRARFRA